MPNKLARREPASFTLAPRNLDEAMSFARLIADSDLAPKDFKGKPGNVLVAVQMGAEVGLSPMQAVQTIAVINGRPSMYGDGFLAVIQSSPAYVRHDETFDAATGTATCRIWRKGNPEPHVGTFSRADAQKAGLIGKPGPWTQYERRMLQMRARGFAGRDGFSDALRGIALREEVEDYATIENPAAAELIPMPKATPATATPEAQTVIDTPPVTTPASGPTTSASGPEPAPSNPNAGKTKGLVASAKPVGKSAYAVKLDTGDDFYVRDEKLYNFADAMRDLEEPVVVTWERKPSKRSGETYLEALDIAAEEGAA